MNEQSRQQFQTRRQFFGSSALSLAPVVLSSLLVNDGIREMEAEGPLPPRQPHYRARAKSVNFLFQIGGPRQLDLFEPKSVLLRRDGEPLPDSILKKLSFAQIHEKQPNLMGLPWMFARHGECGATISELLPHTASIVD